MIVTVTLNPAIDITYQLDAFILDGTNRVQYVTKTPGGKGLNVSRVLNQIGDDVIALGFVGGHNGTFITEELAVLNIKNDFTRISSATRNCISILHNGQQTELLEKGPSISASERERFVETFLAHAQQAEIVVLSGSLSDGLPVTFYKELIEKIADKKVILDTSNQALLACVSATIKPFAIKPNLDEISQLLNRKVTKETLPKELLQNEWFKGIEMVCVSLGGDGAIVKYNQNIYHVSIPKIQVVNPVGSGDSVVAGLASGLQRNYPIEECLKHAMVLGMLNAQEAKTGYINVTNYAKLKDQIQVTRLNCLKI